jgi:hypothetical protein
LKKKLFNSHELFETKAVGNNDCDKEHRIGRSQAFSFSRPPQNCTSMPSVVLDEEDGRRNEVCMRNVEKLRIRLKSTCVGKTNELTESF